MTTSLSDKGSLLKLGALSFGSPVISSSVSKTISEIKATEDKNNISTPMLSGSRKNVVPFVSLDAKPCQKAAVVI